MSAKSANKVDDVIAESRRALQKTEAFEVILKNFAAKLDNFSTDLKGLQVGEKLKAGCRGCRSGGVVGVGSAGGGELGRWQGLQVGAKLVVEAVGGESWGGFC